jgi:hypothetical protein
MLHGGRRLPPLDPQRDARCPVSPLPAQCLLSLLAASLGLVCAAPSGPSYTSFSRRQTTGQEVGNPAALVVVDDAGQAEVDGAGGADGGLAGLRESVCPRPCPRP